MAKKKEQKKVGNGFGIAGFIISLVVIILIAAILGIISLPLSISSPSIESFIRIIYSTRLTIIPLAIISLIFCIIGRKTKLGKIGIIISGIEILLIVFLILNLQT